MKNLIAWLRQPTTIAGIAGLAGVLTGVLSGAMPLPVAASTAVAALVAIAMPDNTGVQKQAGTAAADLTTLAQSLATVIAAETKVVAKPAATVANTGTTSAS